MKLISPFASTNISLKYFLIIAIVSCFITGAKTDYCYNDFSSNSTNQSEQTLPIKSYDVIIVPGVPFKDGKWDRTMKGRVYWSYYLYKKGIAKNIIYSGSSVYSPYIEAKIMALYAAKLGVKRENIFTEEQAEHSTENVYYSYKLAQKLNFKTMALTTDPFQSKMLKGFINRYKLGIDRVPFNTDTLEKIAVLDPEIEYETAFVKNFIPITERDSWFKRMKCTMGIGVKKRIDKQQTKTD